MFEVNNNDNRTGRSGVVIGNFEHMSHLASIVDSEQINAGRDST